MATRISVKKRKRRRDQLTAYKKGETPKRHKTSESTSRKHRLKMANPMV